MTVSAASTGSSQSKVLLAILEWSADQPTWQRDAIRRLIEARKLKPSDFLELLAICRKEHGLLPPDVRDIKAEPVTEKHFPVSSSGSDAIALTKLSGLKNVNRLPDGRSLDFGLKGLTVVYGDNGAGKSSFAKVLKRACRARNRGDAIQPDVFKESPGIPAEAIFSFSIGAMPATPVGWKDDGNSDIPELGQVSFFDSSCASIHVTNDNDIAFLPFGLDVMESLGGVVCPQLKVELDKERANLESTPAFKRHTNANGEHKVAKTLSALSKDTEIRSLKELATLSALERTRLDDLPALTKDPMATATAIRQRIARVESLLTSIHAAATHLDQASTEKFRVAVQECREATVASQLAAGIAFSDEPLTGVGSETWVKLWESARRFSEIEAYTETCFPKIDDGALCVLCEQPLAPEASERLRRFETFVKDDAKKRANAADAALHSISRELRSLRLRRRDLESGMDALRNIDEKASDDFRKWLIGLRLARRAAVKAVDTCKGDELLQAYTTPIPASCVAAVDAAKSRARSLESSAKEEGLTKLQEELVELKARDWLGSVLIEVLLYIRRLRRLTRVQKCLADVRTNTITAKSKSLADEYITGRIRDAFADEIKRMDLRGVNVELVKERGQYGQSLFRVRLIAAPKANIGLVLSEGEHRAIGLAAFLSELSTCGSRSPIVFDDPVTSLDHRWRGEFARRLIEEAGVRQVIVFTHDLVFLHDLLDQCDKQGVEKAEYHLSKGAGGVGTVSAEVPWKRQNLNAMFQTLDKEAGAAKKLHDAQDDDAYEGAAARWYERLRALCERVIEQQYFNQTVVRYNDYIKVANLKKASALDTTHCERLHIVFQHCSTVIEGHDSSPGRNTALPQPQRLFDDLKEVRDLVDEVKALQASV